MNNNFLSRPLIKVITSLLTRPMRAVSVTESEHTLRHRTRRRSALFPLRRRASIHWPDVHHIWRGNCVRWNVNGRQTLFISVRWRRSISCLIGILSGYTAPRLSRICPDDNNTEWMGLVPKWRLVMSTRAVHNVTGVPYVTPLHVCAIWCSCRKVRPSMQQLLTASPVYPIC